MISGDDRGGPLAGLISQLRKPGVQLPSPLLKIDKLIREGNVENNKLTKVYKVVRQTDTNSRIYYSGLINDYNRLYYPMRQWIVDMSGLGIFAYKTYESAKEFADTYVLDKTFIMRGEGVLLPRDVTIKKVLINTGIIEKGNMGGLLDNWVLLSPFRIIGVASEGCLWTEWEKLILKPTYCIGDRIMIEEQEYMLAQVGADMINLINVTNGNRWSEPTEVEDVNRITHEELNRLIIQGYTAFKWYKKE